MYAQFFGSYLLSQQAVSPEALTAAISMLADTHIKLGTLAMHMGYMTASEVDEICFLQTREDKRFGEIALERSYLFEDQLDELLKAQIPDYLLLGQTLVDIGCLSNSDLERLMTNYKDDCRLNDETEEYETQNTTKKLLTNFFKHSFESISEHAMMYMNLLFSNLIRFIGEDFTPTASAFCDEYETRCCVMQRISGTISCVLRVDMDEDVAVAFASRYAKMDFEEYDEYVEASMEDFLNLHNGLFLVNMSNMYSEELSLEPPMRDNEPNISLPKGSFCIPVIYPFGTINLIISMKEA